LIDRLILHVKIHPDISLRFLATCARRRGLLSAWFIPDPTADIRGQLRLPGYFLNSTLAQSRIRAKGEPISKSRAIPLKPTERTFTSDILPKVAAGKVRAMEQCIVKHGGIVWTIIRRYLKDQAEAEDLVQEVFTEIWKKASAFNPAIAAESTFVGMIARRRAIDFLRRQGRQPCFETLDAAESLAHDPWETSTVTRDPEAVRSSLASLPADTRELFHLFFDNGFTHPEIAEKTGLPLGTIKTRLRRGLITLRELLQRPGNSNQPVAQ
jgi:RNA polymerase sigma factor (sigma-70 family)